MKFWVFWDFCISLPPPSFSQSPENSGATKVQGESLLGIFPREFFIGNFFIGNFSLGFFLRKKKIPIFYWEFSLGNSDGAFGNLQPRIRIWKNLGILGSSLQNSKEKAGNFGMKPSKFQGKSEKFGLFWDPSSGIPGKNLGILGIKLPEFLG